MAENDPPPPPDPKPVGMPPPPPVVGKPIEEPPMPKASYFEPPPTPVDELEEVEFVDEKVENKLMLLAVHFVGLFGIPFACIGNWLLPLLIWLLKRSDTKGMEREGRAAINFQLSIGAGMLILLILGKVSPGLLAVQVAGFFYALLIIYNIAMSIWAVAMINIGKPAPYPKIYDFLGKIIGPERPEEEPSDPA